MTLIPRSKFGDCSNPNCNATNTQCVKVGKVLFCLKCRALQKSKKQMDKAEERDNSRAGVGDNLSYLIEDLDIVFSQYIRQKYANNDGRVNCYTCSWNGHWKQSECGHYIKRGHYGLRWDDRNARPQCHECNCEKNGNKPIYTQTLELEQPGITEELEIIGRQVYNLSRSELKELLIELRRKLNIVKSKIKNQF